MDSIRTEALGRSDAEPAPPRYRVSVSRLNIRIGPSPKFDLAGLPLVAGTMLKAIGPARNGWLNVRVLTPGDISGWGYGPYVTPYV